VDELVIVGGKLAWRIEVDLQEPYDVPIGRDREHERGLVILPRPGIRPGIVFRWTAGSRLDDDRRQAPQRLGEGRIGAPLVDLP
jgi:hypothetical protein